ncbi:MAG: hypothetical protein AAGA96_15455 [Verrucomicrobiota bacterium]
MHRVPTSCLEQLTSQDLIFIQSALLNEPTTLESLSLFFEDIETLVAAIESDQVFEAVVATAYPLSISPQLYFFVLVRRALTQSGIHELKIADYVAATLASHSTGHPISSLLPHRGDADFTYHVDFVEAMDGLSPYDRFFLQVQCGNSFLVMTGLFPRFLEHRAERRGAPSMLYYQEVARNAFRFAGDHPLANEFDLGLIYPALADRFEETRQALNHMAEDYLFLGA